MMTKTNKRIMAGYKFVSIYFAKFMILIGKPSINGMNFAIRKAAFEKARGFNDKFRTFEDWDLSRRVKSIGKIAFDKNAIVYTSVRRIRQWGILGFAKYHIGNMIRYALMKKPKEEYEPIR